MTNIPDNVVQTVTTESDGIVWRATLIGFTELLKEST